MDEKEKLSARWIDSIIGDGDYDILAVPGDLTGAGEFEWVRG